MEDSIGFFDVIWSVFWIFLMVAWIWVVVSVVADVFRSKDLNGLAKAIWIAFVMLIPWLGVLSYILIRGDRMQENEAETRARVEDAQRAYIRSVSNVSTADELDKLAALREKGVLSEEEFSTQKAKLLAG